MIYRDLVDVTLGKGRDLERHAGDSIIRPWYRIDEEKLSELPKKLISDPN
jgi:hypothetical protein